MRKLFTFLFAALMSVGTIFAERVQIDDLYYNLDADNMTAEVTYHESMSPTNYSYLTAVNIPESVEYNSVTYSVTSIGMAAFLGCIGLTSITIPSSVTSIGDGAFQSCEGLTSIEIPNSVTSIGDAAFYGCTGLTSVTIGNSVTSIGISAFCYCTGLTSMVVASENTKYDSRESCNAIIESTSNTLIIGCKNTIIPNSVTSIGESAFSDCSGLTSITIPNSVESIGSSAFSGCEDLTSITIPCGVTSIGGDAFFGCTNITDVYCYPNAANLTWNEVDCDDFDVSTVCHVFASELTAYRAKFTGVVNVTFEGNLTGSCDEPTPTGFDITANLDPQNAGVYYSTFYHGSVDYALPAYVKAYKAAISGSDLLLSEVAAEGDVLPKGNAVILRSSVQNYTLTPSDATPVSVGDDNDLEGSDDAISAPSNCYVLSGHSSDNSVQGVGFYQFTGTLTAHKAYVIYAPNPKNPAPRRMRFVFDQATGVENVQGDNVQSTKVLRDGQLIIIRNGVRYNMAGQIVK